jgi:hypothetical protein
MIGKLQIFILILISVIAALCGIYYIGNRAGKKAVELKQKTAAVKAMRESNDVEKTIRAMPDDDIIKRLRNDWTK